AEVARLLAMIAGEHAKAAGIDRQRLMERELRGEVSDRSRLAADLPLPPRVLSRTGAIERAEGGIVRAQEFAVVRQNRELVRRDVAQHQHRVVRRLAPQG